MTRLPILDERPRRRGDCKDGLRPCPWISCRYHLVDTRIDVDGDLCLHGLETRLQAKDSTSADAFVERVADAVVAMPETCALDVADANPDGTTLSQVGSALGLTRERIRVVERDASQHLRPFLRLRGIK